MPLDYERIDNATFKRVSDNSNVTYIPWNAGEPNENDKMFVTLRKSDGWQALDTWRSFAEATNAVCGHQGNLNALC